MKRFGSSLREQKPATQKKGDVGWCIKVGLECRKQVKLYESFAS